jgi:RecB family exonuclease
MVEQAWEDVRSLDPALATLFTSEAEGAEEGWLESCRQVLRRYFDLEDPRRLEPAEREHYVEALLDSKLLLRGFIDRVDVAADGRIRVVDYKGLATDTPLPTPTGWTTMASVQVGDKLVGSDGRPTTVLAKSEIHHRPCYMITFVDGSSVVCDNVHLWSVVRTHRQRQTHEVLDADSLWALHQQLVRKGTRKSLWVLAGRGIDGGLDTDLPIDPWLLGAWLGDGDSRSGQITVGSTDVDAVTLLKEHWPRRVSVTEEHGVMRVSLSRSPDQYTYGHTEFKPATSAHARRGAHERLHHTMAPTNVSFTYLLRSQNLLHNKHIPKQYLRASRTHRVELLRGLLDTDGWWNRVRRRAGFTTTDDRLASDVVELLRSLGIHPQHFEKPYQNAVRPDRTWHIIEFTPSEFNPFSLPRKAIAASTAVTTLQKDLARRRIIQSIETVPSVPTQCVAVDAADSLYLCGEGLVPTHNTGRVPSEAYEAKALFQLKFYALVIWRTRGVVPAMLQLIYLGSGDILRYVPDEADLLATERKAEAIWRAIRTAQETGEWQPNPGRLCGWCAHKSLCPAFGGTPPPLPATSGPVAAGDDVDLD